MNRANSRSKRQARSTRGGASGMPAKEISGEEQVVIDLGTTALPVLPTKDLVAFPRVMLALYVSKPASVAAVQAAAEGRKLLFLVAQRPETGEFPRAKDLYKVGVVANLVRTIKTPDNQLKVLIQGLGRASAVQFFKDEYLTAKVEAIEEAETKRVSKADKLILERIRKNLQLLVEREHLPEEMLLVTEGVIDPGIFCDSILAHYRLNPAKAQVALEELDISKRLKLTDQIITDDVNQFLISETIRDKARNELNKGQREYYLREQIRQIQSELGESDAGSEDLKVIKGLIAKAQLPKVALKEAQLQLGRLERMSPDSGEYALLRTYLDWIAELPWSVRTKDRLDLKSAKRILDHDHYGLQKVKERILEYLSVRKLNPDLKGPILCFVGPPGVGKTSLGTSIARALNRKMVRMSLGGVRDEAEIRGHRRTYVGALPGRILQGMKQAGSRNCVFILDELDKVGADFRGDPASALLEVLDPHQNRDFRDHYLNLPFDLSEVLFIATANTVDTIPEALLDRLEIIYVSGYTTREKLNISKKFIVPRQMIENGLKGAEIELSDEAITYLIERYTLEAGVRNLEREVGSLCRKIAKEYADSGKLSKRIDTSLVGKLLGPTKFDPEMKDLRDLVGIARGLAWTINGGEIMPVEVSSAPGNGSLNLTGQLGSVMQESAQAAMFFARANAAELGLKADFYQKLDIHVHVPGGATPKDGPSAGITICCALISALLEIPVRGKVAMTGEITLRGQVLPVGGLKEKALAALRYGIHTVIIPEENVKDIQEISEQERKELNFVPVKDIKEVLKLALADGYAALLKKGQDKAGKDKAGRSGKGGRGKAQGKLGKKGAKRPSARKPVVKPGGQRKKGR